MRINHIIHLRDIKSLPFDGEGEKNYSTTKKSPKYRKLMRIKYYVKRNQRKTKPTTRASFRNKITSTTSPTTNKLLIRYKIKLTSSDTPFVVVVYSSDRQRASLSSGVKKLNPSILFSRNKYLPTCLYHLIHNYYYFYYYYYDYDYEKK